MCRLPLFSVDFMRSYILQPDLFSFFHMAVCYETVSFFMGSWCWLRGCDTLSLAWIRGVEQNDSCKVAPLFWKGAAVTTWFTHALSDLVLILANKNGAYISPRATDWVEHLISNLWTFICPRKFVILIQSVSSIDPVTSVGGQFTSYPARGGGPDTTVVFKCSCGWLALIQWVRQ